MLDVAIIGAGLSGLVLAERLHGQRRDLAVFEARERCGGRILSHALKPSLTGAEDCVDLGPTWLWPEQQTRITALAERLGLPLFRQWDDGDSLYLAAADAAPRRFADSQTHAGSWRIQGGCGQLASRLAARLPEGTVRLQHRLSRLTDRGDHIDLDFATEGGLSQVQARHVAVTIPPRLLAASVAFVPALSPELSRLMQDTPTWMAGHAKAVLVYPEAFWRRRGYSGNALLPYPGAVLAEVYDACPARDKVTGALFGFFGVPAAVRDAYRGQLQALVVRQMMGLYGAEAAEPLEAMIQDWSLEPFTATDADRLPPTAHPVYGRRLLSSSHWQDKLYFCGTETAPEHGGYLEGALEAGERVFSALTHRQRISIMTDQPNNADSIVKFKQYVVDCKPELQERYGQSLAQDLSRQQWDGCFQRNVLAVLEPAYEQALAFLKTLPFDGSDSVVVRGMSDLTKPVLAAYDGFIDEFLLSVVDRHRTSCALSNFPGEHKPDKDYLRVVRQDVALLWQNFALAVNAYFLEAR